MKTQTINIQVTNAFSTVTTSLKLRDLEIISQKTTKKLVTYLCEKLLNNQLAILNDKFFTVWNSQDKETKNRLISFFHVFITDYEDSDHQFKHQQLLLEDISQYCLLEIAPLDYWTGN